jgi:catechol-2,3-dioxygenase
MKLRLDTLLLFVNDVEAMKHFYCNVLNLTIQEEIPGEWVLLRAGGSALGLHAIGADYQEERATARYAKLIFELTEEPLADVRKKLLAQNVKMHEVKIFEGDDYERCDGEDPEGNVFQLIQKQA